MIEPTIIVQGGAGDINPIKDEAHIVGVKRSVQIGYKVLKRGGSVIDAVEAAVRDLEDDPTFNSGKLNGLPVIQNILKSVSRRAWRGNDLMHVYSHTIIISTYCIAQTYLVLDSKTHR